jgi:hypothetical protein
MSRATKRTAHWSIHHDAYLEKTEFKVCIKDQFGSVVASSYVYDVATGIDLDELGQALFGKPGSPEPFFFTNDNDLRAICDGIENTADRELAYIGQQACLKSKAEQLAVACMFQAVWRRDRELLEIGEWKRFEGTAEKAFEKAASMVERNLEEVTA